jgi:phosphoribosylformylglycinamidine (FGAM) synthase-like enzyme
MCACGEPGEDAKLFDTVRAVGLEFCPAVGVSIPVGKDSLSMRTVWQDSQGASHRQVAPLSLIVSAFAPVRDVRKTVTPDLKPSDSSLLLLDLGKGRNRLGASALAQVHNQLGDAAPDADDPALLKAFFDAVQNSSTAACCWPTTTVPTAASSSPWPRWLSPADAASTLRSRVPTPSPRSSAKSRAQCSKSPTANSATFWTF